MALWAFHNNPGIGGFGESTPILFDRAKGSQAKEQCRALGKKKKRRTEPESSFDSENQDPNRVRGLCSGLSVEEDTVSTARRNDRNVGEADLVCQIVKELVDNAVDACRGPASDIDSEKFDEQSHNHVKRIRVDIKPLSNNEGYDSSSIASSRSKMHSNDVLQLTVTDTGHGMENIQSCVNPFQTNKGGSDGNDSTQDISSGRYGIGLTLCLLHAQRCVPNSRACISSATPKSKHITRAFFEVNKQEDSIKCVQEETIALTSSQRESGTCVSLLIPGGRAANLAWPRLFDYFTRFKLSTKLNIELCVVAPTLSRLPIFIRRSESDKEESEGEKSSISLSQDNAGGDQWKDALDSDNSKDGNDSKAKKTQIDNKERLEDCTDRNNRSEFAKVVGSYWPNHNVVQDNVAKSSRKVRNLNGNPSTAVEAQRKSMVQLEVSMAICPHEDIDQKSNPSVDSTNNDGLLGNEKVAKLQLVRIVNDVPIIDNAEAHSCGLVHGVSNERVWGSFGIDIERSSTKIPNSSLFSPSFDLRDSSLVAPFINRNANHTQLNMEDFETGHCEEFESNTKKRKKGPLLYPVNVRFGTILLVVHIRANPSSLPLPTLSKGRLPLHNQHIDEALQLGLADCIVSLQKTNPGLFLTTSQLRTAERDALYVPALASAVSRIVCNSRNPLLRSKSMALIPKDLTSTGLQQPFWETTEENGEERTGLEIPALASALESRLRLALRTRYETAERKRRKRHKGRSVEEVEEFDDIDSDKKSGEDSFHEIGSNPRSSDHVEVLLSSSNSTKSLNLLQEHSACQEFDESISDEPQFPPREIFVEHRASDDEESFEDCL